MTLQFTTSIAQGKPGERIFLEDFLMFLGIKYKDVTGCQQFQVIDTDFITSVGKYEIKTSYKDNKKIIIEDFTNINSNLGQISYGWISKTKADLIVFVSKKTRAMVFLPFTERFKKFYHNNKDRWELKRNRVTEHKGRKWQSAFRVVPFDGIRGFVSVYKKIGSK